MSRYISLIRFTEQGARALGKSPARALAFRKAASQAGAKVEAQFWTVGAYDGLLIISAPNEKQALRCLAKLAAAGNVRTESMQALDADEFQAIAGK